MASGGSWRTGRLGVASGLGMSRRRGGRRIARKGGATGTKNGAAGEVLGAASLGRRAESRAIGHRFPCQFVAADRWQHSGNGKAESAKTSGFSAVPARFERATCGSEDRCSIQLSYGTRSQVMGMGANANCGPSWSVGAFSEPPSITTRRRDTSVK